MKDRPTPTVSGHVPTKDAAPPHPKTKKAVSTPIACMGNDQPSLIAQSSAIVLEAASIAQGTYPTPDEVRDPPPPPRNGPAPALPWRPPDHPALAAGQSAPSAQLGTGCERGREVPGPGQPSARPRVGPGVSFQEARGRWPCRRESHRARPQRW